MSDNDKPIAPPASESSAGEPVGPIEKSLEKHFEKLQALAEERKRALAEAEVAIKLARR